MSDEKTPEMPAGNIECPVEHHCPQCGELINKKGGEDVFWCKAGHTFNGVEFLLAQIDRATQLMEAAKKLWQEQLELASHVYKSCREEGHHEGAEYFGKVAYNAMGVVDVLEALIIRIQGRPS